MLPVLVDTFPSWEACDHTQRPVFVESTSHAPSTNASSPISKSDALSLPQASSKSVQLVLGQSATAEGAAEVCESARKVSLEPSSFHRAETGPQSRKRKREGDIDAFVVHRPWDLVLGPDHDVLVHSKLLDSVLSCVSMVHFGPNCATFSRAREFPIPGVKFPPRPLRSKEYPEGLPDIPSWDRERVANDTATAQLAARKSLEAHARGGKFSLEHPGNSLAKELEEWKELMSCLLYTSPSPRD